MRLPNIQRLNVVNIYLPPTASLMKCNIPESQAIEAIEDTLDNIQPQFTTVICGDFNARIGNRIPDIEDIHPHRTAVDKYICTRAPWFIQLCTKY